MEHCESIDHKAALSEQAYDNKQQIKKVANKQLFESQLFNKISQLGKEGKLTIFKELVYEAFSNALYLDQEFIVENYQNLKNLTDSYIDENGGYQLLESSIEKTKSPLLKKIASLCEATSQCVCKRKFKQTEEECDLNTLNFDLDDEEQDSFNYEKGKIGIDQLSDMVKNKVLTVVQDEKTRQQEEDDLYSEIENELTEDENATDEKSVNEALNKIVTNKNPIEESTLFNALLRHSYKELLENQAVKDNNDEVLSDQEKKKEEYNINAKPNGIDVNMDDVGADDSLTDDSELELDMDLVLAEALTKYTLMETLYTLQLKEYDVMEVQKLIQQFLN
jgi:hypothetical protein